MTHIAEGSHRLAISVLRPSSEQELLNSIRDFQDVCFIRLPTPLIRDQNVQAQIPAGLLSHVSNVLATSATLIIFGDVSELVHLHAESGPQLHYHSWIAIKQHNRNNFLDQTSLPHQHVGAMIYTKYEGKLNHSTVRLEYTYCLACNRTTKDYGGKKHTYHHSGTLISDVWRDIAIDATTDISPVLERFADLFGIEQYREIRVVDLSMPDQNSGQMGLKRVPHYPPTIPTIGSHLVHGDSLTELRALPDNSIDFAFADPPYNLKKDYHGYKDDLNIEDYFSWCDQWISEVARVLRLGGTFALLNIPLWSIRHFLHLETALSYQNWIVWDALSFPVRRIMPSHYTILCFSKGEARPLPGLSSLFDSENTPTNSLALTSLKPLAEDYCIRASCVSNRSKYQAADRGRLTDIWWDIHRLKHNSRRVDHPCQLPPQLLYRLITLFTEPGELVLDCFNGAGTTTLAAHQLGRRYIGIEIEEKYHQMAVARHYEIQQGIDPFRKEERILTEKNSSVKRRKKQKYEVTKKILQLEVRRIAQELGRLPTRTEVEQSGQYPIRLYNEYFASWGEVCAAARTTGMTETRDTQPEVNERSSQPRLF